MHGRRVRRTLAQRRELEAARTPLRPWLAVAARNRAIDCYNALRRRETVTLDDGLAETLGELAEFDRATTEAADLVGALVAAMTPPDRDIFSAQILSAAIGVRKSPLRWV